MRDKDVTGLIQALAPAASAFICTRMPSPRAADTATLASAITSAIPGATVDEAATPLAALERAATLGEPIVVAGSLYLAGEIREVLS